MRVFNALVITVALTMMLTPSVNADIINPNLIINGSFENPDIPQGVSYGPVGGWAIYYEPILGWTPTTGGLEIQDRVVADVIGGVNLVWLAYNGDQFAELDAYGNGGMSQTVNTISDQKYNFSFAYSPRPGPDHVTPDSLGVEIYFNDMLIDSFSLNGIDLTDPLWSVRNYTLTATGTSSTFKLLVQGLAMVTVFSSMMSNYMLPPTVIPTTPSPNPPRCFCWERVGRAGRVRQEAAEKVGTKHGSRKGREVLSPLSISACP